MLHKEVRSSSMKHPRAEELLWRLHRQAMRYGNIILLFKMLCSRAANVVCSAGRAQHPPADSEGQELEMGVPSH